MKFWRPSLRVRADGDLRTRDDDGLAERRQQEGQRRGRVGHRVGPVQDDEAGVIRSALVEQPRDRAPVLGGRIGGVDRRVEFEELDRGQLPRRVVDDPVEVGGEGTGHRRSPLGGVDHPDGPAGVEHEHAFTHGQAPSSSRDAPGRRADSRETRRHLPRREDP